MPIIEIHWEWEEAFYKFGFDDGDGVVNTGDVARELESLGYTVETQLCGMHNDIITKLEKDGTDLIAKAEAEGFEVGYDDPREYLPDDLAAALDRAFPD